MPLLACLSASAALYAAAPAGASAHAKRAASQAVSVKPDFAYYVGKTVTLYAGGAPGGTFYALDSIIAPAMASYLRCTINIVDVPAAATVPEQNDVAASAPNGLTFGEAGIGTDISQQATHTALINFALSKVVPIGANLPTDNVLIVQPSAGVNNLSQLLADSNANILGQVSGIALLTTNILFHAYGSKAPITTGFANATAAFAGFLAGDGTAEFASLAQAIQGYQEGKAIAVANSVAPPAGIQSYAYFKSVPTLAVYAAKHPPKTKAAREALAAMISVSGQETNQLLFAPKGTPAKYAAALTAAFRSVMAQKSIIPEMLAAGLAPGYMGPAKAESLLEYAIKSEPIMARFLND